MYYIYQIIELILKFLMIISIWAISNIFITNSMHYKKIFFLNFEILRECFINNQGNKSKSKNEFNCYQLFIRALYGFLK